MNPEKTHAGRRRTSTKQATECGSVIFVGMSVINSRVGCVPAVAENALDSPDPLGGGGIVDPYGTCQNASMLNIKQAVKCCLV